MASRVASKLVKPPISIFGLEGRYVNALYSAAAKSNKVDAVEGDLKKLTGLFKTDRPFREFLVSPLINPSKKSEIFKSDLKNKLKLDDLSVNFLSVMSENQRLKNLPDVQMAFGQITAALRNEVNVTITSAKPLPDAKRKEVEESIKAFSSKKLLIKYEIDESLVGGLIVDFNGEHYIDMSVRSKIRQYTDALQKM